MESSTTSVVQNLKPLPPEIWLKIFEDAVTLSQRPDRPQSTLGNVSTTCRAFRNLTQPMIFRTFVFHPFSITEPWDALYRSTIPLFDRMHHESQRLDFYASDPIASHVHHLNIRPWCESPPTSRSRISTDELLGKFFSVIARFTNARSLTCANIDLTYFAFQQLSTLPYLRSLDLVGCSAPPLPTAEPMLRLHDFKFWHLARSDEHDLDELGIHRWLTLLDPNLLQVLHIAPGRCSSYFFRDVLSETSFPSLHTLHMTAIPKMLTRVPLFLSKTPALHHLRLSVSQSNTEQYIRIIEALRPTPTSPTPYLKVYDGPHELLPFVLGRPGSAMESSSKLLRRLHLTSLAQGNEPLDAFANTLESLSPGQLIHLTHLHVTLRWAEARPLAKLCTMFPGLLELSLGTADPNAPVSEHTFLDEICSLPLPRSMSSLSIDWTADPSTNAELKHITVKDHLLIQLPSLRRLWLCDWTQSALLWRRTELGEESSTIHTTGSVPSYFKAWESRIAVFGLDL